MLIMRLAFDRNNKISIENATGAVASDAAAAQRQKRLESFGDKVGLPVRSSVSGSKGGMIVPIPNDKVGLLIGKGGGNGEAIAN